MVSTVVRQFACNIVVAWKLFVFYSVKLFADVQIALFLVVSKQAKG